MEGWGGTALNYWKVGPEQLWEIGRLGGNRLLKIEGAMEQATEN